MDMLELHRHSLVVGDVNRYQRVQDSMTGDGHDT